MKRFLISAVAFAAFVSMGLAQDQPGVPAKMQIAGLPKPLPVFLQRVEDGRLYFQRYRQNTDIAGPISKIAHLEFMNTFDAEGVRELYRNGEFELMVSKMETELKPSLDEYWPYMRIDNNFQDVFCMLTHVYLELGDYDKATKAAAILVQSNNSSVLSMGQSVSIMIALKEGRIEEAETLLEQIDSPAGVLYFRACIERAKKEPKAAIQLVTQLIAEYGNDLDWMPKAELLCAYLYQDMAETQPEPYLSSAKQTARQVKQMYAGTNIAGLAQRLEASIAELQAKLEAEAAAKAAEEEKAREEVRARAEARAKAVFSKETESSGDAGAEDANQDGSDESGLE